MQPLTVACAAEMVHVLADAELYTFVGGEAPTITELEARYRRLVTGSGNDDEVWYNWIVRRGSTAWRSGEAAKALLQRFLQRDATRVTAHIHLDHLASHRVAAQIGLIRTPEIDDDGESVWASDAPTTGTAP